MGGVEFIGRVRSPYRSIGGGAACHLLACPLKQDTHAMLQVVSNRMQKTVVVAVSYVVWMPKYKVYQKRTSRHKVTAIHSRALPFAEHA